MKFLAILGVWNYVILAGVYLGHRLAQLERGLQIATIGGSILFLLFLITLLKHHGRRRLADETSPS